MSSPIGHSEGSRAAIRRLRERRETNTVTLRYAEPSGVLVPDVEGNLTHDELVGALPPAEPRLVIHELSFASSEGTRRRARLLILWLPADVGALEEAYAARYTVLKEDLADVHVHLTARRTAHLASTANPSPWPPDERSLGVSRPNKGIRDFMPLAVCAACRARPRPVNHRQAPQPRPTPLSLTLRHGEEYASCLRVRPPHTLHCLFS